LSDKKYYWLKMEHGFFGQKEIKKLRRIAGGDTYVIIYLKMSLLSLKDDGKLYYEGVEDSFVEELAYELDEKVENVEITISYLIKHNMLEESNSEELYMNRITEMTGTETDSAKRKRRQRLRENSDILLPKCDNVQISHTEKEKELEKDIETNKEIKTREHFNKLWLMYPRERRPDGKKNVTSKTKKILFNISEEEWQKVLDRYKKEYPDYKFWKHCFRFMNNETFNIYLDVNYVEPKQTTNSKPDKWRGEQNFDF